MARNYRKYPPPTSRTHLFGLVVVKMVVWGAVWAVIAIGYYFLFSAVIDTPAEHSAKRTGRELRQQYEALSSRLDTLESVMDNVVERDKNVFRILFESEPYAFNERFENSHWKSYDKLMEMSNKELVEEARSKLVTLEQNLVRYNESGQSLLELMEEQNKQLNSIPAIQPIVNRELTLLTASYGMRIHPFYKNLTSHQGVDYTIPEGSSVFATADGTVRNVTKRSTSSGLSVTVSHKGGYETVYSHLGSIDVKPGQQVKRGDIIAHTGNTGLSLSPHLHYEVKINGMRVDPIHYFFMELSPEEYARLIIIAQSGMQSFD